jgi:hypothetical protein
MSELPPNNRLDTGGEGTSEKSFNDYPVMSHINNIVTPSRPRLVERETQTTKYQSTFRMSDLKSTTQPSSNQLQIDTEAKVLRSSAVQTGDSPKMAYVPENQPLKVIGQRST